MSEAAFKGTFSDFKILKSRKVIQIVIEVPLEGGDAALEALGGLPRPDQETWVGVARLETKAPPAPPAHERKDFDELPYASQITLMCKSYEFRCYMRDAGYKVNNEDDAINAVKEICGVASRKEITTGTPTGEMWEDIKSKYNDWKIKDAKSIFNHPF